MNRHRVAAEESSVVARRRRIEEARARLNAFTAESAAAEAAEQMAWRQLTADRCGDVRRRTGMRCMSAGST